MTSFGLLLGEDNGDLETSFGLLLGDAVGDVKGA